MLLNIFDLLAFPNIGKDGIVVMGGLFSRSYTMNDDCGGSMEFLTVTDMACETT